MHRQFVGFLLAFGPFVFLGHALIHIARTARIPLFFKLLHLAKLKTDVMRGRQEGEDDEDDNIHDTDDDEDEGDEDDEKEDEHEDDEDEDED